ncbi:hypothetical protein [Pseudokordiimonas caeni]|uniref:hypothetical protein n=1 Tax=Pseudokordiimonas caeni TaxID=2997908 RepID=UPI0028126151|nr:hypothetical protein [Pseudokordiimonas caeni]
MPRDTLETTPEAPIVTGHAAKLVDLTRQLGDLFRRETQFLRQQRPEVAQSLHGEKARLISEYRDTLGKLQTNQHLLGAPDSPQRQYIRSITDGFRETLKEHARIVLRLKAVTEGIVRSVGEDIARQNRPVAGYGRNAAARPASVARPTSIAINQTI